MIWVAQCKTKPSFYLEEGLRGVESRFLHLCGKIVGVDGLLDLQQGLHLQARTYPSISD